MNRLRNKCRTCRFLALNEGNTAEGYCWQCDKPVYLLGYGKVHDPECQEIIADGDYSEWMPTDILAPYFWEEGGDE